MSSIYVFPGQGAQSVGMGYDLYQNNDAARAVFDEMDAALGEKLSDIIFNGPIETLTLTSNVQPAILATSVAMFRASGLPSRNTQAERPPAASSHRASGDLL